MAGTKRKNNKRKPEKSRKKSGMGSITILLVILVVLMVAAVFISKRYAPSKVQTDLREYYNLTADEDENRLEAEDGELAIVLEDEVLSVRAFRLEEEIFVPFTLVKNNIDDRFYYDSNEDLIIVTTANDIIKNRVSESILTVNGSDRDAGYTVSRELDGKIYLNIRFVDEFSAAQYSVHEDPDRVYITYLEGNYEYGTALMHTYIRTMAKTKADYIQTVEKGDKLKILDDLGDWLEIIDESGCRGYIQAKAVTDIASEQVVSDYQEAEYTHIDAGDDINMVWDAIYYYDSNYEIYNRAAEMTGVDVLCPTWFTLADDQGNLNSYVCSEYITFARENGMQVWTTIEDIDGESCAGVIDYTSKRETLIANLIEQCLEAGIDGINVDFENISTDMGNDYIQFMRELSVACRDKGLILSVDTYAPYAYNSHFHFDELSKICDYVVVMAYDDYLGGDEAGPCAGLPFVQDVIETCAEQADLDRLIVGIPFYTRAWYEYSDGSLGRDVYNMYDLENIEWNYGLTPEWLEDVGYDFSSYESGGATVKIWMENYNSINAKLELIKSYDVAGIASWRLGQETSDIWALLESYY